MRSFLWLAVGLFLLGAGPARAADVIFQAKPEEIEKHRQAKLANARQSSRDLYDKIGKRNPKWDAEARLALDAACRFWTNFRDADSEACWEHARNAVKAGCDDPLILYLYGRYSPEQFATLTPLYEKIAAGMAASRYPPIRRAHALLKAALFIGILKPSATPEEVKKARALLDQAAALLPEVARDTTPFGQGNTFDLASDLVRAYHMVTKDYKASLDKVAPTLQKDPKNLELFLLVTAEHHIQLAWEARGTGLANTVTEQGWKGLREQIALAEADLERAWKSPTRNWVTSSRIAVKMMTVELAQGKGRDRLELWFRRALEADSDNTAAVQSKLYYLEPKWHGSPEEMLAFAHQCAKTENWEAGFPIMPILAHRALAAYLPADKQTDYFKAPKVWKDFQTVHEGVLKRFPQSKQEQTAYASNAMLCGQFAEAHRQFEIIKDNYSPYIYGTEADYRKARDAARTKSGAK